MDTWVLHALRTMLMIFLFVLIGRFPPKLIKSVIVLEKYDWSNIITVLAFSSQCKAVLHIGPSQWLSFFPFFLLLFCHRPLCSNKNLSGFSTRKTDKSKAFIFSEGIQNEAKHPCFPSLWCFFFFFLVASREVPQDRIWTPLVGWDTPDLEARRLVLKTWFCW